MYLVKNVSSQEIALGDLKIALRPGQKFDLDTACPRYVLEQSRSLKFGVKKGIIKIVKKDGGGPITTKATKVSTSEKDNTDIIKAIKESIKESEKRMIERQNALAKRMEGSGQGLDESSVAALNQAIAALENISKGAVAPQQDTTEFDLPDEKAVEVHKRTIDRVTKNTKGNIKHSESKTESNVDDKIDELENLL